MKISHFFSELYASYEAEIDDLRTNTAGANVLQARLDQKRSQLTKLLPMMAFSPEMVAVIFHCAFKFNSFRSAQVLLSADPDALPNWEVFSKSLTLAPWAVPLEQTVLAQEGGAEFLVHTAAMEFLMQHHDHDHHPGEDDSDTDDLSDSGGEWMAEQGFDRLG